MWNPNILSGPSHLIASNVVIFYNIIFLTLNTSVLYYRGMVKRFSVVLIVLVCSMMGAWHAPAVAAPQPTVMISEIKVKNTSATQTDEFIELYNNGVDDVSLNTLSLDYYNVAKPVPGTLPSKAAFALPDAVLAPGKFVVLAVHPQLVPGSLPLALTSLKDTEGQLRLQTTDLLAESIVIDQISWKDGTAEPDIYSMPTAAASSLQKLAQSATAPLLFADGWAAGVASPGQFLVVPSPAPVTQVSEQPTTAPAATVCDGVELSEILPNPASTDTDHEFIEIHNPTDGAVLLSGCALQVGTKTYQLPAGSIAPGAYLAFYDSETSLTLPNAAGGQVTLITSGTEQVVQYPADMKDNQSLALVAGSWQATASPTPSAANQLAAVEAAAGKGSGDEDLTPCAAGKYRNPETNRCKNIETASDDLTPCRSDQERNPETNRCRSVLASTAAALTPCKEGQERNPETNRCRSVVAAATDLKPCDEGEERNPDTNRCRKVTATASQAAAAPTKTSGPSKANYVIFGSVAAAVASYGAYEYRQDLRNKFATIKTKFFPTNSGK